jgi:hypothetical protein
MNIGKKTSWQVVAIAAAALLSGAAQADGRDHRGRGDDRGWRDHDRSWHHGKHHRGHRHGARARHWVPLPPPHWRHSPRHRHHYDAYYRSNYWVPDSGGVRVVIGFPLY